MKTFVPPNVMRFLKLSLDYDPIVILKASLLLEG